MSCESKRTAWVALAGDKEAACLSSPGKNRTNASIRHDGQMWEGDEESEMEAPYSFFDDELLSLSCIFVFEISKIIIILLAASSLLFIFLHKQ